MEDLVAGRVMSDAVHTVDPSTTVAAAGRRMLEAGIGSLLVDGDDGLAGIVTSTDLVRVVAEETAPDSPVSEIMSVDVVTAGVQTPITEVAELMADNHIHHVPVVDGDTPIGMVASSDLATYLSGGRLPPV